MDWWHPRTQHRGAAAGWRGHQVYPPPEPPGLCWTWSWGQWGHPRG